MGAEALCRGAAIVVGIEQSSQACGVIQQNWQQVAKAEQSFQVIRGDVVRSLAQLAGQSFDRIYFDPPYASDLYEPVLAAIAREQMLAPLGELAVEHSPGRSLPEEIGALRRDRQKTYGNTAITFYSH
jgi:16S rRNA (guanine(966)-N(2))-methyltransferase RsmD